MSATICRFIRINGNRCCSPALTGQPFCYFHDRDARRHRSISGKLPLDLSHIPAAHLELSGQNALVAQYYGLQPTPGPARLDLPPLEDRTAIQAALSMVISALAQDRIDPKRANAILYGLQVASANAKAPTVHTSHTITETIFDEPSGLHIAPDADPDPNHDDLALIEAILQRQEANREEGDDDNEFDD